MLLGRTRKIFGRNGEIRQRFQGNMLISTPANYCLQAPAELECRTISLTKFAVILTPCELDMKVYTKSNIKYEIQFQRVKMACSPLGQANFDSE